MKAPACILLAFVFCLASSCNDKEPRKERGAVVNEDGTKAVFVDWLDTIVIPKVDFKGASIGEAIEYAWYHTKASDTKGGEVPLGISVIVTAGHPVEMDHTGVSADQHVVDFTGENISFFDLITEIARQGHLDAYLTSVGIFLVPEGAPAFPNCKADEGAIWKILRKSPK